MTSNGEEIVRYVTQKVVEYMETPEEQRKEQRQMRKKSREPWVFRWFGMIPLGISMLFGKRRT